MMQSRVLRLSASAVFLILAVIFFFVRGWFVAVPTLFAAVVTAFAYKRGGVAIPLALLFSAAGDWAGSMDNFLMQVAFFAVGHICFICDFAPRRDTHKSKRGVAALTIYMVAYLAFILSHISSKAELVAVTLYALIIFTMGATAILQRRCRYGWYVVAALLFILSDSLIVYGKYIGSIPNSTMWIMTTYYAAQGLFMTLHLMRRSPEE